MGFSLKTVLLRLVQGGTLPNERAALLAAARQQK